MCMNLSFRQNEDTISTTVLGDDVFVIVITSVVLLTPVPIGGA